MKKTFYISHEDFAPDGDFPGNRYSYKVQAETPADALTTPIENQEEQALPDGLKELYRISVWV